MLLHSEQVYNKAVNVVTTNIKTTWLKSRRNICIRSERKRHRERWNKIKTAVKKWHYLEMKLTTRPLCGCSGGGSVVGREIVVGGVRGGRLLRRAGALKPHLRPVVNLTLLCLTLLKKASEPVEPCLKNG